MNWVDESFYHVYNRAISNEILFRSSSDYARFMGQIIKHLYPVFEIHAHCLIPNHFHLLVKTRPVRSKGPDRSLSLSRHISNLASAYAKYYNHKYARKGSLFIRPFKSRILEDAHDYSKVIQYIHFNPVHHGLVPGIKDWSFSSYVELLAMSPTFLERPYVLKWFGGTSQFVEFHDQPIGRKKGGVYLDDWTT